MSEYLQKAQELKDEIIRMTETVQQRINDSTDQELRDAVDEKERQVMSYKVTVYRGSLWLATVVLSWNCTIYYSEGVK